MSRDQVNHLRGSGSNGGHRLGSGHHLRSAGISDGGSGQARLASLSDELIQLGFALHLKSDLGLPVRLPGLQQTEMTAGRLFVSFQDGMTALGSRLSLTLRTDRGRDEKETWSTG